MGNWFTTNKDLVAGLAGLATVIAFFAAAGALLIAARQVRQQREQGAAQAIYGIQKDARELSWRIIEDDIMARAVYGEVPEKANLAVGTAINFYSASFEMWRHGVLDDRGWGLLLEDLTHILNQPYASAIWSKSKQNFDVAFREDVDSRLNAAPKRE